MLLGFRWEPEQYYDLYGRQRYIMIGGCVAKLIATGLYVFQGVRFDEAGTKSLKILYQGAIGYEYQKVQVTLKDPGPSTNVWQSDEMEYCQTQQNQTDMYEPESGAEELLPGIGFEKIRIYNRILFHWDARVFNVTKCCKKLCIDYLCTVS